jgi:ankyrin
VNKCIFNVELVTDDVEKAVARVRLDQPGFDSLKEELGPSRNTSLRRDATMDPKMDPDYEEPDRMKVRILCKSGRICMHNCYVIQIAT